jgi:uncharacterized protein YqeY
MSIKATLTEELKAAMKARATIRLATIRALQTAIKEAEISAQKELEDPQVLDLIQKQLKQRQDSEALYEQNDRPDLALRERQEAEELQSFLPQAMSQDEIDAVIEAAIAETGASSIKDMGKVIALIKPQVAGRADNAAVAQAIKQRLG